MLNDWSGMNVENAVKYIKDSLVRLCFFDSLGDYTPPPLNDSFKTV